jgi:hypothetical protein
MEKLPRTVGVPPGGPAVVTTDQSGQFVTPVNANPRHVATLVYPFVVQVVVIGTWVTTGEVEVVDDVDEGVLVERLEAIVKDESSPGLWCPS